MGTAHSPKPKPPTGIMLRLALAGLAVMLLVPAGGAVPSLQADELPSTKGPESVLGYTRDRVYATLEEPPAIEPLGDVICKRLHQVPDVPLALPEPEGELLPEMPAMPGMPGVPAMPALPSEPSLPPMPGDELLGDEPPRLNYRDPDGQVRDEACEALQPRESPGEPEPPETPGLPELPVQSPVPLPDVPAPDADELRDTLREEYSSLEEDVRRTGSDPSTAPKTLQDRAERLAQQVGDFFSGLLPF